MSVLDYLKTRAPSKQPGPHPFAPPYKDVPLTAKNLEDIFSDCGDLQKRALDAGLSGVPVTAMWLDGIVSGGDVSEDVLRPLTEKARLGGAKTAEECAETILRGGVYANTAKMRTSAADTADDMTHGWCAVVFDGAGIAVTFEVRTGNTRGIAEPTLEKSVKGAKDSFVETLRINTSLVRRRICTPALKLKNSVIGRKSLTRCAVMYVDGVADPEIVDELTRRLDAIDVDGLTAAGYIEEYICDAPRSPLPQVVHTERPDRFAAQLLNGRVGLIVDGLSFGFLVPASLSEFMRVSQDNSNNFLVSTALSVLRWLALLIGLVLPAFAVAAAMYHQEMIPTKLLLSIIKAKQDVPFSVAVEVTGMLIAFELLQEAGHRLPNPVGGTVSIIGALVVGQSAVDARLVSPLAVIIVAMAGVCGYTMPSQDIGDALRIGRLLLVLSAILAGLFGVAAGLCLMTLYLCSLESFGVNYMSPMSNGSGPGLLRALVRVPKAMNKFRDPDLRTPDRRRQR